MEFDLLEYPLKKWVLAHSGAGVEIFGKDGLGSENDSHHIYSHYNEEHKKIDQELEFWFDLVDPKHETKLYGLEKDPMLTNMLGKVIANIPMVYSSIVKTLNDEFVEKHQLKKVGFVTNEQTIILSHIEGKQLPLCMGIMSKNTKFSIKIKSKERDPLQEAWAKMGL